MEIECQKLRVSSPLRLVLVLFLPGISSSFQLYYPRSFSSHHHRLDTRVSLSPFSSNNPPNDKLIPQENPDIDPHQKSQSGLVYQHVLQGLNRVYPPEALEERNAASRTDGYWPFIQKGSDPPKQFTYGEFDFLFFAQLLDKAHEYYYNGDDDNNNNEKQSSYWNDKVFCDIGSGTGRLVLGAAALHPGWKLCRGIEILQGISNVAQSKLEGCQDDIDTTSTPKDDDDEEEWVENEHGLLVKQPAMTSDTEQATNIQSNHETTATYSLTANDGKRLPLAPIKFVCGSFEDPYLYFGDVDCVFCFSSCMSTSILQSLSHAIGRQCRPGAIVITTDFSLELKGTIPPSPRINDGDDDEAELPYGEYELEVLEQVDGYCWLTGGQSTAYIHRVKQSLWDGSGPRTRPTLAPSEKAFQAIKAMEAEREEAAVRFLSGVRNNMFFAGFPERWLPDPSKYKANGKKNDDDNMWY